MRIAYFINHTAPHIDGPLKKALEQAKEWSGMGHECRLFLISGSNFNLLSNEVVKVELIPHYDFLDFIMIVKRTLSMLKDFNPDIIYTRPTPYLPFLVSLYKYKPTIFEINASEKGELKLRRYKSFYFFIKYYYLVITYRWMYRFIKGFIFVNHKIMENPDFGLRLERSIVIPNSISLSSYQKKRTSTKRQIPNLLFISGKDQPWHGLDTLIKIASLTQDKLFFHIIGPIEEKFSLPNVKYWGFQNPENYQEIVRDCDIGVGSLAFKQFNMLGCPLKVREYLAFGLPIIIGYEDPAFLKNRPDWVYQDEDIYVNYKKDIQKIVEFCYEYKDYVVQNDVLCDRIDSSILEKDRINFFQRIINGSAE